MFSAKKTGQWTISRKMMTERAKGLGRNTRQEIGEGNQMTALKFRTSVRHQTSQVSLWGVCSCMHQFSNLYISELVGWSFEPIQLHRVFIYHI